MTAKRSPDAQPAKKPKSVTPSSEAGPSRPAKKRRTNSLGSVVLPDGAVVVSELECRLSSDDDFDFGLSGDEAVGKGKGKGKERLRKTQPAFELEPPPPLTAEERLALLQQQGAIRCGVCIS